MKDEVLTVPAGIFCSWCGYSLHLLNGQWQRHCTTACRGHAGRMAGGGLQDGQYKAYRGRDGATMWVFASDCRRPAVSIEDAKRAAAEPVVAQPKSRRQKNLEEKAALLAKYSSRAPVVP